MLRTGNWAHVAVNFQPSCFLLISYSCLFFSSFLFLFCAFQVSWLASTGAISLYVNGTSKYNATDSRTSTVSLLLLIFSVFSHYYLVWFGLFILFMCLFGLWFVYMVCVVYLVGWLFVVCCCCLLIDLSSFYSF